MYLYELLKYFIYIYINDKFDILFQIYIYIYNISINKQRKNAAIRIIRYWTHKLVDITI
jgi:hypothetical protein